MKLASVLFGCCMLLASCGFRPLYSGVNTLNGGSSVLDTVSISSISGTGGQQFKNELIDRFYNHGYPENAAYVLTINLSEATRGIVIQKDDVTSRAQVVVIAQYTLTETEARKLVSRGTVRAVGSYNILGSQYSNIVMHEKARDWALKELADKMALRVSVLISEK